MPGVWAQAGWGSHWWSGTWGSFSAGAQGTCLMFGHHFDVGFVASEIQPKNLQKEAEEWEFCEAQLPILLLCCRQQGSLAVCLGEPPALSLHCMVGGMGRE